MNLSRRADKPASAFGEGIAIPLSGKAVASAEPRAHEPIISCPECQTEIKLTESLAAPLLRTRELEFKRLEAELREREAAVARQSDLTSSRTWPTTTQ